MNTMELVRMVERARPRSESRRKAAPLFQSELIGPARQAILRARQFLLSEQQENGSWVGVQTGGAPLASQFVLLLAFLGDEQSELAGQASEKILKQQLPCGGWSRVPGGQPDLSTSVQAYFALKLAGVEPVDERLSRARQEIRRMGGADAADSATRFFLALLGQVDYGCCAAMPPEALLFNGSESRLRVPLSIVWSHRPMRDVGIERGVRELFVKKPSEWPTGPASAEGCWRSRITGSPRVLLGSLLRRCEEFGWTPLRGRALDRAECQLVEQVQPGRIEQLDLIELLWHAIAVRTMGFSEEGPEVKACDHRLEELASSDDGGKLIGPRLRTSPAGDTAVVLRALRASGLRLDHPAAEDALLWLSRRERCESLELRDLANLDAIFRANLDSENDDALPPAIEMCRDKWSAGEESDDGDESLEFVKQFGANIREELLKQVSKPLDTTAPWVWEIIADKQSAVEVQRAAECLRAAQCADGGWDDDSGIGRIQATALAVRGLLAAGVPRDDGSVAAGVNWLIVHQQQNGGWGEVIGEARLNEEEPVDRGLRPTASHTAFALLALASAGKANHVGVRRGVQFLVETQEAEGSWQEPHFVTRDATGYWCGNNLHSVAWPLLALSQWAVTANADREGAAESISLRLVNEPICN